MRRADADDFGFGFEPGMALESLRFLLLLACAG
jgi:hypothetical protein